MRVINIQLSLTVCIVCLFSLLPLPACGATSATSQRLPTRALTPTSTSTPFFVAAQTYYREGIARQEAGDAEGAIQSFTWAIQRAPDFAPAYVARGASYLGQGEPGLALENADAALEIDSNDATAHVLRGEALRLLGQPQRAVRAFDQALALDPALKKETFQSRWQAARSASRTDRLVELSSEYASLHPSDPLRSYYLGWALVESNEARRAISALVAVIETTPDPPAVLWFALGQAYAAERSWQEAVVCYEATRTLVQAGDTTLLVHSDDPIADLFAALGRAYLGTGRCVDAETMLEYAVTIGASSPEYGDWLQEARSCQTPTPTITPYPTTTPSFW